MDSLAEKFLGAVLGPKPDDRAARDLAVIKARESAVKDAIRRGEPEVDCGPFGMSQLGLLPVVADEWGRLWICKGQKLVLANCATVRTERWDLIGEPIPWR